MIHSTFCPHLRTKLENNWYKPGSNQDCTWVRKVDFRTSDSPSRFSFNSVIRLLSFIECDLHMNEGFKLGYKTQNRHSSLRILTSFSRNATIFLTFDIYRGISSVAPCLKVLSKDGYSTLHYCMECLPSDARKYYMGINHESSFFTKKMVYPTHKGITVVQNKEKYILG